MSKIGNKKKLLLALWGLILAFVLIELSLNIYSNFYKKQHSPRYESAQIDAKKFNIICLGDSFTYGVGAGFKNSYPAQLEEILKQKNEVRGFKVYNLGVPGQNSSQVLLKLKENLKFFKPDIVIVMIGCNDHYNFEDVKAENIYLLIKSKIFLSQFRILKLLNISIENLKCKFRKNNSQLEGISSSLEVARRHKLNCEYDKTIELLLKLFRSDPNNKIVQLELKDALIRQNKIEESIRNYRYLLNDFPGNNFLRNQLYNSYIHQAGYYLVLKKYNESRMFYKKALDLKIDNKSANLGIQIDELGLHSAVSSQILSDNLDSIVKICKEKRITLMFSGYPHDDSRVMLEIANLNNIPLVDQKSVFDNLLIQAPLEKYFISKDDRHCTKEGYQIIAKNIASIILKSINKLK
ncbi:MAG: hypothetical protein KJ915_02035 [Candidatus Omnitrophica bacterium]|nr:hypothetical protein [Candidatus Omnitrophota bacterium]